MKFKSKSLISIVLSIMMVISMIIVAIPANAAVVDNKPVCADTYYLWYSIGNSNLTDTSAWTKCDMTSSGSSYVATVSSIPTGKNVYFIVNNDSSHVAAATSTWSSQKDVTDNVTYDSSVKKSDPGAQAYNADNPSGNNIAYFYPYFSLTSSQSILFTFTPSKKVVVSEAGSTSTETTETSTTAPATGEWFLIGGSGIGSNIFDDYSTTNTYYPLSGTGTVLSRSVTFASGGATYFRIHNKDKQYSLNKDTNAEIGDENNPKELVEDDGKAIYFSNNTGSPLTVNICLDTSTTPPTVWYESATEPTTTEPEYTTYTPDVPTIKLYAADGKTEISAVEQGTGFIIKVTSPLENNVVYRFFKSDGLQVGSDQSDGILEIATDDLTVGETYTYKVQAVYNGNASGDSNTVSIKIDDKAGNKQVTIYFKSASASAYVPSLSIDGATAAVMTREAKTAELNGTYFGSTYSGSLKFYWFYTTMTLDTTVEHTLKFTTKDNRVNASTSYKFVASEGNNYYFAVDNLMGDTNLINLTGLDEYIRNYHISATHMVYSEISDNNIGFTWIDGTEYAMGTYLKDNNIDTASLSDLTSSSLLTIPSALTPNAMLEASSAPAFFTIKSATLAQRITAEAEEVSTLQYQLLDVNLDGKVDVKDSTMMQKALAGF